MSNKPPVVLTIAGSDSGGGAGIQADIKTMQAFSCFATSVITAITAQNSIGVTGIENVSNDMVQKQLDAVFSDFPVSAVKIGMLSHQGVIEIVAQAIRRYKPPFVVLDPVMVAKSGDALLLEQAVESLKNELLPLADVITPNLPEAEKLLNKKVGDVHQMEEAAKELSAFMLNSLRPTAAAVVVKGGHLQSEQSDDLLYIGKHQEFFRFPSKRIDTPNTHGTGCTFSSAIASSLAWGLSVEQAVAQAKRYIHSAIESSFSLSITEKNKAESNSKSHGAVNHITEIPLTWPANMRTK